MIETSSRIYLAGHRGMVGSALHRLLTAEGYGNILTRSHTELDLTDQPAVEHFFREHKPQVVLLAAARVGGIGANHTWPATFIYENLMIEANVIHAAWRHGVERLLFLGSSCIYPRHADQPMTESALLTGRLEPTNEPYAVAKIAGIKLCESYNRQHGTDFRSVMPTNLYGPGDNFDPDSSHVIPALLRRFHDAVQAGQDRVSIWGSGKQRREFLYVDDMAAACMHILGIEPEDWQRHVTPMQSHINIGTGEEVSIAELARQIAEVTGYTGELVFDHDKPDGAPRKLLDTTLLRELGWEPRVSLAEGLKMTCDWYLENAGRARGVA